MENVRLFYNLKFSSPFLAPPVNGDASLSVQDFCSSAAGLPMKNASHLIPVHVF